MGSVPDGVDDLFLVLDPVRGLRRFVRDAERSARLDPKIAEAQALLMDRLATLSDQGDVLAPLLWLQVREQMKDPAILYGFGLWLGNGELALRTVEDALDTTLGKEVLAEVLREASNLSASESLHAEQLSMARGELSQVRSELPEENPALAAAYVGLAFAAGFGLGYAAAEIFHHH